MSGHTPWSEIRHKADPSHITALRDEPERIGASNGRAGPARYIALHDAGDEVWAHAAFPGDGFPGVLDGETVSRTFLSGPPGFRFRQARFAADEHRPVIRDRRRVHNAGAARLAYELEAHHPVPFEACNVNPPEEADTERVGGRRSTTHSPR